MRNNDAGEAEPDTRRRAWRVQWSADMKTRFLDHLAATCNVKAAAAVVDVDPSSVYGLRRRDKAFRANWAEAVEAGYEMLETQLVGHELAGGGPVLLNGDVATTGPIDVKLAMALLTAHRGRRDASRDKEGPRYRVVTAEQTDASIQRKLKAMRRYRTART